MIYEIVIDKINKLFLPTKVYCIENDSDDGSSDLSMSVLQQRITCDLLLYTDQLNGHALELTDYKNKQ